MQRIVFVALTALSLSWAALTACAQAIAVSTNGPRIQFASEIYDFGRIKSGELVKTAFVFTNAGDQVLEVTHVQPSCGCTTAGDWSRRVEPGQTGSIPLQFNSMNFNGAVLKTATVTSNDKLRPTLTLQVKGTIWKPIEVQPQFAVLNLAPDAAEATTVVRVVVNTDESITLSAPETSNPAFKAQLTEVKPGKEFEVKVTVAQPVPQGNVQSLITMKSNSTNAPVVSITAWANVQPALQVMPAQIHLPPPPMAQVATPSIIIQNNSTNVVSLSDPTVSAAGVTVQVNETQPGRTFNLVLTFPPGFEVAAGQPVELTVKTTHPRFPVLKVPVIQAPRPAVLAAPPTPVAPSPVPPAVAR
jgi:hypothetical protein